MKTFPVKLADGSTAHAVQLTTFAHYIDGKQFRFVVTMLEGYQAAVTHRASGRRVCNIPPTMPVRGEANAKASAKAAVDQLVSRAGAALVATKLAEAEA